MKTITVAEMALELGVGERKVYQLLREGQIPNLRNGWLYIVSRTAFFSWLSSIGMERSNTMKGTDSQ
jgi:excisionase family DNA binding protein